MAWFDKAKDAGSIARQRLNARAGMPSTPAPAPLAGRGLGFNPLFGAYAIPGFGEQKAQNRLDVMQMAAGPLNELRYMGGQLMQGRLPYTAPAQKAQQTGMYGRYASPSTQSFTPGVSAGSSSFPAAERAYQQEASRVAQLTAQDPELQRYELARQKAVAAGAGSAAEQSAKDLGMQMWAKANPTLAAEVKPGQSGYEAIQGTLVGNAARTGQGFGIQEQLVPTPQGFPTSVPGFPEGAGFGAGFNIPQALTQTPSIPFGTQQQAVQAPVAAAAAQSAFGQPSVLDTEDFERLLQQLKK